MKNDLNDLSTNIVNIVRTLDQGELVRLIHECEAVSTTNCWWASYWCAPLLRQLAADTLTIPRPAKADEVKNTSHNSAKPKPRKQIKKE